MSKLLRPCLQCGKTVRGKSYCRDCQAQLDKRYDQAKAARRPGFKTYRETERRRRAVADHRATIGDWCPGVPKLSRPAHPSADPVADHLVEVAAGGAESGPLVVRCRSCNAARSGHLARTLWSAVDGRTVFPMSDDPRPACQPDARLHTDDGPAVP